MFREEVRVRRVAEPLCLAMALNHRDPEKFRRIPKSCDFFRESFGSIFLRAELPLMAVLLSLYWEVSVPTFHVPRLKQTQTRFF